MATVEDAVKALTDPDCVAGGGRLYKYVSRNVVLVNGGEVLNRIRPSGEPDDVALALIDEALRQLKGRNASRWRSFVTNRGRRDYFERLYEIPLRELRHPPSA